ncbi:unnamed protein product [Rhizophagus irregularis]|nr:unnamed protein product [Rhizophagus irregularis]CAB5358496.1 unnamed protein product [Rhizophagus irregularis]
MKRGKKTLTKKSDFGKKKADQIHSDCFFEEVIKNMDDDSNKNDDPVKKMFDSFVCAQLRKVSINTWNMINSEFIGLKDLILSHYISNFSEKECEKFWNGITIVFTQILQPITNLV